MLFASLLRHQWKRTLRSGRLRHRRATMTAVILAGSYVAFALFSCGFLFREMLKKIGPGQDPVFFLNRHLLTVFLALMILRFFVQRTPRVMLDPYLHLPIPLNRLVHFFQLYGLTSLHNLLPLLFFIPFWGRHLVWEYGTVTIPSVMWMVMILVSLIFSQFFTVLLRTLLVISQVGFVLVIGTIASLACIDLVVGGDIMGVISATIFYRPLGGNYHILILAFLFCILTYALSTNLITRYLHSNSDTSSGLVRLTNKRLSFNLAAGTVQNLLLLELKLLWRHKRTRFYALFAVIFGFIYTMVLLLESKGAFASLSIALACMFASSAFVLNYGQMMFSWESSFFDGYLVRNHSLKNIVLSKLILLQTSCIILFLITLPLFVLIAPRLILLDAAFMVYNAGITSVWVIALAVRNRERIDLRGGAGILNYEGISAAHWMWFIFTTVPPVTLFIILREQPLLAASILGGAGIVSSTLINPWSLVFSRQLAHSKHLIAAGFRVNDG